jgi:hypothetical protein
VFWKAGISLHSAMALVVAIKLNNSLTFGSEAVAKLLSL